MEYDPYKVVVSWEPSVTNPPCGEVLKIYFEGGLSGGGSVQEVQLQADDSSAVITFNGKKGVDGIVTCFY